MKKITSEEIKEFVSKPLLDEKVMLDKDPSWPKISIVTISFNQGKFLEEAIRSVVFQNYTNIEYIVVDAGSTDNSRDIIRSYADRISHIIFEKDNGPADGLNKGFSKATGEILCYLNSDDFFLPGAFQTVARFFLESSNIDVVSGNGYIVNSESQPFRKIYSHRFSLFRYAYDACHIVQQATFFRKEVFEKTKGFNIKNFTCWDGELMVDMALQKAHFTNINSVLAAFRMHEASISYSIRKNERYVKDRELIFQKVMGYFPHRGDKTLIRPAMRVIKWITYPVSFLASLHYHMERKRVGFMEGETKE